MGCRGALAFLVALLSSITPAHAAERAWPVPRLVLSSPDGGTSMWVELAAQFRVDVLFEDQGGDDGRAVEESVQFRRIRPLLAGTLVTRKMSYLLQLNVAPGAAELVDLFGNYAFTPDLQLLVGQTKIPFTRYRMNSFKALPVTDWSFPTRYLGAERQIGLALHNGFNQPSLLEYELGVYTGVNARASNGVGIAKITREEIENPSSLVDGGPVTEIHPAIVAHVAYNRPGIDVRRFVDVVGGPPRYSCGLSAAWDLAPRRRRDFRLRVAPEIMLKLYGFALTGVFYVGLFDERLPPEPPRQYRLAMLGGVAMASYFFLDRFAVAVRYTRVQVGGELNDFARDIAERAVAEAPADELEEVRARYAGAGDTHALQELDLAADLYIFADNLKWQVEGSLLTYDRTGDDQVDYAIRTQIQLAL